jgi:hypothetical protein
MLVNLMMKFKYNTIMLIQIMETKALRHKRLVKAQHPLLNGSTNSHFLIFQIGNGRMISEVLLSKKLLCKHVNSHIQMWP